MTHLCPPMGSGGVQHLLIQSGRWCTITGSCSSSLGQMVLFALRGSKDIPPHSSPYPSRKERVWGSPLSHISNVLSHTNTLQLCANGLCSKQAVLQHLLLGHICGPLCHLNSGTRGRLLCIPVTSQWSCFIGGSLGLFQQTKWRARVCCLTSSCLRPPLSNIHLWPFPYTTR